MKQAIKVLAFFISTTILFAQSPQKMSYQVVIRNSSNQLLSNTLVGMRISILQGTITGNSVYTETQTPTTNANGLATLQVGAGTVISGSISAINWGAGPFFLKSETDPAGGTNYSITGTSQLLSVPYALYAEKSGPAGANIGDMMYWDGTKWAIIPVAKDNVQLTLCGGVPTWGNCVLFTTNPVTSVTTNSAISGINIITFEDNLSSSGICYGILSLPTIKNNIVQGYGDTGSQQLPLTNLKPGTTYYVRAYTTNSFGTSYGNEISFTTLGNQFTVGQYYGGGRIFYIDGTGQHGLIADTSKVKATSSTYTWGCSGTSIQADSVFGSGQANTTAIVSGCTSTLTAAKYANDLVVNGYTDWFLPSLDEFKKLAYPNILDLPGNTTYWTSSQLNTTIGNAVFISPGGNGYASSPTSKNSVLPARAIRKF